MELLPITLLYILAAVVVIFGVMYIIRRQRDKESGRPPSNKVKDIKEEETKKTTDQYD
jgi:hypothetical protein